MSSILIPETIIEKTTEDSDLSYLIKHQEVKIVKSDNIKRQKFIAWLTSNGYELVADQNGYQVFRRP